MDATTEPPAETQTTALFALNEPALLPLIARNPLAFGPGGQTPVLSVITVLHNQFALTMSTVGTFTRD